MARPAIHAARAVKSVSDTQQQIVVPDGAVTAAPASTWAEPSVSTVQTSGDKVVVAPNPNHRFWALPLAGLAFVTLGVIVLAVFVAASALSPITKPYARVPSDAEPVEPRVSFAGTGVTRYPAQGKVLFVTVRDPEMSVLSWFMFRDEKAVEHLTYTDIHGTSTPAQENIRGQRQMIGAQQAAEYAALKKLGFNVSLKNGSVVIYQVECLKANASGSVCEQYVPAGSVLQGDDEIVKADDTAVTSADDLRSVLDKKKPGDTVKISYNRAGVKGTQTGDVKLIADPNDAKRAIIGITLTDTRTVSNMPFKITYSFTDIGGPSAGLALTLTLIDELTLGELTGGQRIAVTGTIDVDGNVGAIGGLVQKASAVWQTGAKYFIVPESQGPQDIANARAATHGQLTIVTVKTLDDALNVLAELGGNSDHLTQPGKDFKPTS